MENFEDCSAVICFGASYLQKAVRGRKGAAAVTWELICLQPGGMWACVKTARNQQYFVRGSSRDGKKRIWENTNGSLAGMCPSLSIVFPKAPRHLLLLRCGFLVLSMHLPGANHPCRTRGEVYVLHTSKESSATWARELSALPSAWRSQGLEGHLVVVPGMVGRSR